MNGHEFRFVRQGHIDMSDEGAVKTVLLLKLYTAYSFNNN